MSEASASGARSGSTGAGFDPVGGASVDPVGGGASTGCGFEPPHARSVAANSVSMRFMDGTLARPATLGRLGRLVLSFDRVVGRDLDRVEQRGQLLGFLRRVATPEVDQLRAIFTVEQQV